MASYEDSILDIIRRLGAADRSTLLAFAEFLLTRTQPVPQPDDTAAADPVVPEPQAIPRPERESVVAAVKRLSRTYPMLDKSKMLGETSDLVGQHVVQGREAVEVIDELETVFKRHYRAMKGDTE